MLEHHGHAAKLHVWGKLLHPGLQDRLEVVAMRAAIREELDDLDLLARFHWLRIFEPHIILPLDQVGRARRSHGEPRKRAQKMHRQSLHQCS